MYQKTCDMWQSYFVYNPYYIPMFFELGFTPCKSEEPLQSVELQKKKRNTERLKSQRQIWDILQGVESPRV